MNSHNNRASILRDVCIGLAASLGTGIATALLLSLAVMLIPGNARAAGDEHAILAGLVRPAEVGRGSLLLRTDMEGLYRHAPVLHTDVDLRVSGMVVRAKVVQRFRNPGEHWAEGVYVFPLPDNAAVDHMRLRVGGRVIEGVIEERLQARRTYERAKRAGRKASLVEQERPNMFTTSVANIGPGEQVSVEIEYQQALRYNAGQFSLRFPMVVGPRYIAGRPAPSAVVPGFSGSGWAVATDEVPDAARITPPVLHPSQGTVNPVALRVDLDAGFPLRRLESRYHPIRTEPKGPGRVQIRLADATVPADRDFELAWVPDSGHAPAAARFTEQLDGQTYSLFMILPPASGPQPRLPREVIFVIDTSGSMAGDSIDQARAALRLALARLTPADRFNVIQFNSVTDALFDAPRPAAGAAVQQALRYADGLRASGGTEMGPALELALNGRAGTGRVRQVIFLTDGSIGNEARLFDLIRARLGDSRLFTVGIGSAPNAHFMRTAARHGRGSFTYIGHVKEVQEKMRALFAKLETPVMTDLRVTGPDGEPVATWPRRLPDVYSGEPVTFTTTARMGEITVSGTQGGSLWRTTLAARGGRSSAGIAVLWARNKIAALMDGLHTGADPEQVRRSVIEVAMRHHLVTRHTSLVAVDVTPSRPEGAALKKGSVPANLPRGWRYEKVFGALPQTASPAPLEALVGLVLILSASALCWRRRRWIGT